MGTFQVFYRNVFSHLKHTGSIAPSSRFLAQGMLHCLKGRMHPMAILEVGPGTGSFTKPLAARLEDGDRLDLCELNDEFVAHLRGLLETHPAMNAHKDQITLYHMPVEKLEGEQRYDVILSGLPFNNFEPDLVQRILDQYRRLLKPGGCLSFFEYVAVRHMKKLVSSNRETQRVKAVGRVLHKFFAQYEKERRFVALNLPSSIVHVCRFD